MKFMFLEKARNFAKTKHGDQKDDEGKNYFDSHVCGVVNILSQVANDHILLCAAYLHDTIEDTGTTYEELCKEFNKEIADLVMEVTHEGKKDERGYYFPRLKSHKGILLKFADRLSNISRMGCWSEDRQKQYLKRSKFWRSE